MSVLHLLQRQFTHAAWANREATAAVRAAGSPPDALRVLGHVIGAERLWLARIAAFLLPSPSGPT